jgi:hypothetical protein
MNSAFHPGDRHGRLVSTEILDDRADTNQRAPPARRNLTAIAPRNDRPIAYAYALRTRLAIEKN